MRKVTLQREETSDEGTFGTLKTDTGFTCYSGELPWRGNLPDVSCIPAGSYQCTWRNSLIHGYCYHVENVPNRTGVEIHAANFVGDESMGFKCELKGCIALGLEKGLIDGQRVVLSSQVAIAAFHINLNEAPFELTILDI